MGIGSHQSRNMRTDEWLTPKWITDTLGPFDLDPCSPIIRPWDTARVHYTLSTELFQPDGLSQPWFGRIWLNPPYGKHTGVWLKKLSDHGNGIALIFARTETEMFFNYVWNKANSILFIKGRVFFCFADGKQAKTNSGAPSCLVAYGKNNTQKLKDSGIEGKLLQIKDEI